MRNFFILLGVAFLSIAIFIGIFVYKNIQTFKDMKYVIETESNAKPLESAELPEQLKYLEPAIAELAKIKAEKLGDGNQEMLVIVEKAVNKRIDGMSSEEAKKNLKSDYILLTRWLKHPDLKVSNSHAIKGYYIGILMFNGVNQLTEENNQSPKLKGEF